MQCSTAVLHGNSLANRPVPGVVEPGVAVQRGFSISPHYPHSSRHCHAVDHSQICPQAGKMENHWILSGLTISPEPEAIEREGNGTALGIIK